MEAINKGHVAAPAAEGASPSVANASASAEGARAKDQAWVTQFTWGVFVGFCILIPLASGIFSELSQPCPFSTGPCRVPAVAISPAPISLPVPVEQPDVAAQRKLWEDQKAWEDTVRKIEFIRRMDDLKYKAKETWVRPCVSSYNGC
jgi:hypothetical protein